MRHSLKANTGMALLMVLIAISILTIVAVELVYMTQVELKTEYNTSNELKAFYYAKGAATISLLRLQIYNSISKDKTFGQQITPDQKSQIWKFSLPIKAFLKESQIDGDLLSTIQSDNGKININLLGNPRTKDAVIAQLKNLLNAKFTEDDDFRTHFETVKPDELLTQLTDWVSSEKSADGGDKNAPYLKFTPSYKPRSAAFQSLEELHFVAGMNDEIYEFLTPHITTFGNGSININEASDAILKSISSEITDEILTALRERLKKSPFKDISEFVKFLEEQKGFNSEKFNKPPDPVVKLSTDDATFIIEGIGISGDVKKTILMAVTNSEPDAGGDKAEPKPNPELPNPEENPELPSPFPKPPQANTSTLPRIIYWRAD